MNISAINPGTFGTVREFVAAAIPLTVVTIWVAVAFQRKYFLTGHGIWTTLIWPIILLKEALTKKKATEDQDDPS